jgi:hypothetical protein
MTLRLIYTITTLPSLSAHLLGLVLIHHFPTHPNHSTVAWWLSQKTPAWHGIPNNSNTTFFFGQCESRESSTDVWLMPVQFRKYVTTLLGSDNISFFYFSGRKFNFCWQPKIGNQISQFRNPSRNFRMQLLFCHVPRQFMGSVFDRITGLENIEPSRFWKPSRFRT